MRKLILMLFMSLWAPLFGLSQNPVGMWKYYIRRTPDETYIGVPPDIDRGRIIISKTKELYTALIIKSDTIPIRNLSYKKSEKKLEGIFDFEGVSSTFSVIFKKNKFEGIFIKDGIRFSIRGEPVGKSYIVLY